MLSGNHVYCNGRCWGLQWKWNLDNASRRPPTGYIYSLSRLKHSKHQERAPCSWWPAPPSIFADDLVVSSRCQTVLSPVVTWLRDLGFGGQKQPDPYAWSGQRESVSSTYSFIYGRQMWEGRDFHVRNNSYQKYSPLVRHIKGLQFAVSAFNSVHCPCFRSIQQWWQERRIVDAKLSSVTQPTLPPDTIQLGHNGLWG